MLMGVIVDVVGERDERSRANNAVASACVDCGAGGVLFPATGTQPVTRGYKGTVASKVAGITYRQLDYWARRQIVEPSITPSHGSGSRRLYSFKDVVILAVSKRLLDAGINLQNVTTAISFLTQRTAEQLENITIMCDGQQVHECTDSEQMVALLQSGRAVFGVSVGSLWKQIRETLAHEEYVDLTTMPSMMGGNRPVDDITAMRMRKNFEAQHQTRAAASL